MAITREPYFFFWCVCLNHVKSSKLLVTAVTINLQYTNSFVQRHSSLIWHCYKKLKWFLFPSTLFWILPTTGSLMLSFIILYFTSLNTASLSIVHTLRTDTIHSSTQTSSVHLVYFSSVTQNKLTSLPQNIQGTIIEGMSWVVIATATHPKEAHFIRIQKNAVGLFNPLATVNVLSSEQSYKLGEVVLNSDHPAFTKNFTSWPCQRW